MIRKIFGPPGTGKTTYLLDRIDEIFAQGVSPSEVCFLSLTTAAIDEAISRMTNRFGRGYTKQSGLCYFQTIHAFCFGLLDVPSSSIMKAADNLAIAKTLGWDVANTYEAKRIVSLAGKIKTGKEASGFCELADRLMADQYLSYYAKYKSEKGKIDFDDMQEIYVRERPTLPNFKAVFVDEAQDLLPIQWVIVKDLLSRSPLAYVAGDDDQAIYGFAGAEVDRFLELPGEVTILQKSYRLPALVHQLSQSWVSRINSRQEKAFLPKEEKGMVDAISCLQDLDFRTGQWLLLGRTETQTKALRLELEYMGVPYSLPSSDEWKFPFHKGLRQYKIVERFMREGVTPKEYRALGLPVVDAKLFDGGVINAKRVGFNGSWEDLMKGDQTSIAYIRGVLTAGFKPEDRARIRVSTFHKAKGGEADSVVVDTTWPNRSRLSDQDTEHRCFYVAATRAKKNLYLLQRKGKVSYEN